MNTHFTKNIKNLIGTRKKFSFSFIILLIYLFFTPFVFILIKLLSLIKININFAILDATRIGGFAPRVEIYLSKKRLLKINSIDIFSFKKPISNKFLMGCCKNQIIIFPYYFVLSNIIFLQRINYLFSFKNHHMINNLSTDRDVENVFNKIENQICLNDSEIDRGYQQLKKYNITRDNKIVCLIVRDDAYLKSTYKNFNWNYHDYRDCNVENYKNACNYLVDQGYTVFRMGKIMKSPISFSSDRIIDYSFSDLNSDFMDIFLGHECKFCISTGTGYDSIPAIFRKPMVYTNIIPIGCLWTFNYKYLAILKHHFLTTEQRYLTTSEIFEKKIANVGENQAFIEQDIELQENNPKEILNVIKEMIENIDNNWSKKDTLTKNQKIFWDTFKKAKNNRGSKYYGEIKSKISDSFLARNSNFLL